VTVIQTYRPDRRSRMQINSADGGVKVIDLALKYGSFRDKASHSDFFFDIASFHPTGSRGLELDILGPTPHPLNQSQTDSRRLGRQHVHLDVMTLAAGASSQNRGRV